MRPAPNRGPSPWDFRREAMNEPVVFDSVVTPEHCDLLAASILDLSSRQPSARSLNVGGWKSGETLFETRDPAIAQYAAMLIAMIGAKPAAWAMVNRLGSEHKRHNHQNAIVTALLFVHAGDPLVPTIYECADKSELVVEPHPGRLVICRGDTWHWVPRYDGDAPRITIAADFRQA